MAIEIVDFPMKNGGSFHIPEANPNNKQFPMLSPIRPWICQPRPCFQKNSCGSEGSKRPDQGHWVGMLRCLVPLYVNRGQAKPRVIFTIPSGILIDIIYIYITKYLLWSVKCWIILDNVNDKWYNMTIFSWACCFHVWPKNTGVPIPGGVPLEIWKDINCGA